METKSTNWGGEESSTLSPTALEELPTLTPATVAGLALAVLLAIALVFTMGVLLDCRHQKILGKRVKRLRPRRRIDVESDAAGIAEHMEPSAVTVSVPATAAAAALHAP